MRFRVLAVDRMALALEISSNLENVIRWALHSPQHVSVSLDSVPKE